MSESSVSISKGRSRLGHVLQRAGDILSVGDVSVALHVKRLEAAKLLARWNAQGLVKRLRRGYYVLVPMRALGQDQVLEDAWVIVPELFGPACIGGWSAAEHWGLTEQLFRSTCVLTGRPIRQKEQTIQGVPFVLKHVRREALFGTRPVWRGQVKVEVTSPAKTIIDMLDDPAIGGGIRHVADCLENYLGLKDSSIGELVAMAVKLGNGAVFKRLGFLAERMGGQERLEAVCRQHLSQGNAKLDPNIPGKRLATRWRLWLPASWSSKGRAA